MDIDAFFRLKISSQSHQ